MAVDLFAVAFKGQAVREQPTLRMPYSNQSCREHELTALDNGERDLWSVGMIVLEIVVGPEIVLGLKSHSETRDLVYFIQPWLGARLNSLLMGLLFEVRPGAATELLEDSLFDSNKRVARAIKDLDSAKTRHLRLQKMELDFLTYAETHKELVKGLYGYEM